MSPNCRSRSGVFGGLLPLPVPPLPSLVATEMLRVCAPGGRVAIVDVFTNPDTADAYRCAVTKVCRESFLGREHATHHALHERGDSSFAFRRDGFGPQRLKEFESRGDRRATRCSLSPKSEMKQSLREGRLWTARSAAGSPILTLLRAIGVSIRPSAIKAARVVHPLGIDEIGRG
jgi:hypothetical protein